MGHISFYPGPSRVESKVPKYVNQAYREGILGVNHRSREFMELTEDTVKTMKNKLDIPEDYRIYFVSSATESWEIIGQSFVNKSTYHISYGDFADKWFRVHQDLGIKTDKVEFEIQQEPDLSQLKIDDQHELICITQNETSNGTQINGHNLKKIRVTYPDHLVAVDATSSMAGIYLDFSLGDIWFSSVQKCLGLPAGMAVFICSPRAVERGLSIKENKHYNSFIKIHRNMEKYQTHYTPNVLSIYLLNKVLKDRPEIEKVGQKTLRRYQKWVKFIDTFENIWLLVENDKTRSRTVMAIESDPSSVEELKRKASYSGIVLGNGYGKFKKDTFRIANYPAIKNHEITFLRTFLEAELT